MSGIKHQEDFNLVHDFLEGDKGAGERLYSNIYLMVEKYIQKRTKNTLLSKFDKDEIFEETLLKSVEKLNKYNGKSKFSTFIIGIAERKIKEFLRKKSEDTKKLVNVEFDIFDKSKNPIEIITNKEKFTMISESLDKLSDEYKEIIIFRIFNGATYKEIKEITGRSISSLESLFRRAKKKFIEIFYEIYK
jgi:RNA polymerase sigma factor (sigma-70 family)